MEKDALDKFHSSIVSAAADAIVKEMTPEQLRGAAEVIISRTIDDIRVNSYSPLNRKIKEEMEAIIKDRLTQTDIRERMRICVEEAVNDAFKTLPATARGVIIDAAVGGMSRALSGEKRY